MKQSVSRKLKKRQENDKVHHIFTVPKIITVNTMVYFSRFFPIQNSLIFMYVLELLV